MIKSLSMTEFKNVCEQLSFNDYVFVSENQEWSKISHSAKVKLCFTNMITMLNPNTIWFKDSDSFLQLGMVKKINMTEEDTILGTIFTIICGNPKDKLNDISYTIIAR